MSITAIHALTDEETEIVAGITGKAMARVTAQLEKAAREAEDAAGEPAAETEVRNG